MITALPSNDRARRVGVAGVSRRCERVVGDSYKARMPVPPTARPGLLPPNGVIRPEQSARMLQSTEWRQLVRVTSQSTVISCFFQILAPPVSAMQHSAQIARWRYALARSASIHVCSERTDLPTRTTSSRLRYPEMRPRCCPRASDSWRQQPQYTPRLQERCTQRAIVGTTSPMP
jgi:hypothetical protein